jgi:hypothetical protein
MRKSQVLERSERISLPVSDSLYVICGVEKLGAADLLKRCDRFSFAFVELYSFSGLFFQEEHTVGGSVERPIDALFRGLYFETQKASDSACSKTGCSRTVSGSKPWAADLF